MSIELSAIAEFVGAIAVVGTLLYVAIQVRLTRRLAQASALTDRAQLRLMGQVWSMPDEAREAYYEMHEGKTLTSRQKLMVGGHVTRMLNVFENSIEQNRLGVLDAVQIVGPRHVVATMIKECAVFFDEYWSEARYRRTDYVQAEIDAIRAQQDF